MRVSTPAQFIACVSGMLWVLILLFSTVTGAPQQRSFDVEIALPAHAIMKEGDDSVILRASTVSNLSQLVDQFFREIPHRHSNEDYLNGMPSS